MYIYILHIIIQLPQKLVFNSASNIYIKISIKINIYTHVNHSYRILILWFQKLWFFW